MMPAYLLSEYIFNHTSEESSDSKGEFHTDNQEAEHYCVHYDVTVHVKLCVDVARLMQANKLL